MACDSFSFFCGKSVSGCQQTCCKLLLTDLLQVVANRLVARLLSTNLVHVYIVQKTRLSKNTMNK